jgi:hypothetical protein
VVADVVVVCDVAMWCVHIGVDVRSGGDGCMCTTVVRLNK